MGNSASFTSPASITTLSSGPSVKQNIFNELDEIGLLLGQPRILGEKNATYKQRLAKVFSERASSTYRGLINGVTRGLGLSMFDAIEIEPVEVGGEFVATNPGVIISEAYVYLYEDIGAGEEGLDIRIDRYEKTGNAFNLSDLIERINESDYFTASLSSGTDGYTRSMTIVNQKSHVQIPSETIHSSTKFQFENQNLVIGTVFFSDRIRFLTEVAADTNVIRSGQYHIDYKKGVVTVFDIPAPNTTVRYEYLRIPMVCKASPVIIHNMQSPDFKVKMFEQVVADDGSEVNGLATALGADLVNELLSVFPVAWGE